MDSCKLKKGTNVFHIVAVFPALGTLGYHLMNDSLTREQKKNVGATLMAVAALGLLFHAGRFVKRKC
jgi:hypothetical protein